MAENVLVEGKPRLGWLFDGDPDTPELAVMLQDTGKQVVLTVPTKGIRGFREGRYEQWFMPASRHGDDPDWSSDAYKPPPVLMFQDNEGSVALVGCRATGFKSSLSAGSGLVVSNFAILGATHLGYGKINGMRSELPGLALWSGQRSVHKKTERDAEGRVQKVDLSLDSPPQIPLSKALNFMLRPTWRTSNPDNIGTFAAHDVVELQTTAKRARPWENHLNQHIAMRELLVLAAWRHFGFRGLSVNREDDPERSLSGDPIAPRWADVVTHRLQDHQPWTQDPRFLFTFSDIGTTGVRHWLKLRSRFTRAIQPLLAVADQADAFWETRMTQSGIALEALGYQIDIDYGGGHLDKRGQLPYKKALDVILRDMSCVPLDDTEDWKQRSHDCYMSIKHPDRTWPDALVLANTLRQNLLVLRVWLASRLGCPEAQLKQTIENDPLSSEYVMLG